jgi:beta-galactosidase
VTGLNGWLDGQPAVLTRQVGKGRITYVGAWLDSALLDDLTTGLLEEAGVKPILPGVPEGVEVCRRSGDRKTVLILINHDSSQQHISLSSPIRDLIGDQESAVSALDMPPYGVAVLLPEE